MTGGQTWGQEAGMPSRSALDVPRPQLPVRVPQASPRPSRRKREVLAHRKASDARTGNRPDRLTTPASQDSAREHIAGMAR